MHSSLILNRRWGRVLLETGTVSGFEHLQYLWSAHAPAYTPRGFFVPKFPPPGDYAECPGREPKAHSSSHSIRAVVQLPAGLSCLHSLNRKSYGDYHATFPKILRRLRTHGGTAVHRPPEIRQRGAAPLSGADRQPSLHPQRRPDACPCLGIPRFAGLS